MGCRRCPGNHPCSADGLAGTYRFANAQRTCCKVTRLQPDAVEAFLGESVVDEMQGAFKEQHKVLLEHHDSVGMSALRHRCIDPSRLSALAKVVVSPAGEHKPYAFPPDCLPLAGGDLLEMRAGTREFDHVRSGLPMVAMSEAEEHEGQKAITPFTRSQLVLRRNGEPFMCFSRMLRHASLVYVYADGTVSPGDLRVQPERALQNATFPINLAIWAPHTLSALKQKEAALSEALRQRPDLVSVSLRESVSRA